jgi:ubiquinone/menaquinone biosynthesis C-methylase UbiE
VPDQNAAFIGSIPENYDRYLGPVLFHGYADDLAARVAIKAGMRVLETACGTGIVTERLVAALARHGTIVATDLNAPMLAHAATRVGAAPHLEWRQADATALPFEEGSFDVVVSQFGLMFYADKALGVREAFRVLKPEGRYLFNVWDSFEQNPIARIAHETVASFFPTDAPQFYTVPFSLFETGTVSRWLTDAGFSDVEAVSVAKTGTSPSAHDAAIGLIDGNPIYAAIMERKPEALADIKAALARNIATQLGDRPVRIPLRAFVFSAAKNMGGSGHPPSPPTSAPPA